MVHTYSSKTNRVGYLAKGYYRNIKILSKNSLYLKGRFQVSVNFFKIIIRINLQI